MGQRPQRQYVVGRAKYRSDRIDKFMVTVRPIPRAQRTEEQVTKTVPDTTHRARQVGEASGMTLWFY